MSSPSNLTQIGSHKYRSPTTHTHTHTHTSYHVFFHEQNTHAGEIDSEPSAEFEAGFVRSTGEEMRGGEEARRRGDLRVSSEKRCPNNTPASSIGLNYPSVASQTGTIHSECVCVCVRLSLRNHIRQYLRCSLQEVVGCRVLGKQ